MMEIQYNYIRWAQQKNKHFKQYKGRDWENNYMCSFLSHFNVMEMPILKVECLYKSNENV